MIKKCLLFTSFGLLSIGAYASQFPDAEECKRILNATACYPTTPIPSLQQQEIFTILNNSTTPVDLHAHVSIQDAYGNCNKSFSLLLQPGDVFKKIRHDLGDEFNSARAEAEKVTITNIEIKARNNEGVYIPLATISNGGSFTIQ